ncbi:MAG TPA: 7-carboxy-7-deazaguanine synthase QueE [Lacibacter sp.]|nr:7-carboxy-7-deazaguanine synthase QueE [Lacibacter sp.]HMO89538.1 7-carboxy-7-deazaguanine synthase QueE [Lacibacter sp.]HMP88330.1 7-carboxy-7-deazaguanine synthase QueE [Lacibacter sp.]
MNSPATTLTRSYPVMESFYTLQGEGTHQGKAAYFIRLGGCDVGCVWCDVKESWDADRHPRYETQAIIAKARQELEAAGCRQSSHHRPIAVITGGEPLLHPLEDLTTALQAAGFATHIETSGAHPLSGRWDWICLSPKKFKAPLPEVVQAADELKVVIYHKSDFDWAEQYAVQVRPGCRLYLQPEWDKAADVTPLIIDYIKAHPQWQLSLQIHKYIQVP